MKFRLGPKWLVVLFAFGLPLAFALFTQHAWEDYFITLRCSRNLAEGNGLVFNVGERVHTFTSPLGVLLPAFCTFLTGPNHESEALWIFRLINAALLALAAWILWQRTETLRFGTIGRVLLFGLLLSDTKLNDFSMNGMETAMLVFFLVLLWSELEAPLKPHIGRLALATAGLMWTRPDAFILAIVLIVPHLVFRKTDRLDFFPYVKWLLRGLLLGGLLYLPWFLWAWWYYGSPIPHTIIAKAAFTAPAHWQSLWQIPLNALAGRGGIGYLFLPTYWMFGGWPDWLAKVSYCLTMLAAFSWLIPGLPSARRRVSLALFLGMFYFSSIIFFPWYVPPWTVLAAISIAATIDQAYAWLLPARPKYLVQGLRIICVLALLIQTGQLVAVAWQMRVHQRVVEDGVRRDLGTWLAHHAKQTDTLFLEPLGYIGYFSNLKTYDFPGLSSPEVVAAVRKGIYDYAGLIEQLKPVWVVLRPNEAASPEFSRNQVLKEYELIRQWNGLAVLDSIEFLPGRNWCEVESRYLLFKRKDQSSAGMP